MLLRMLLTIESALLHIVRFGWSFVRKTFYKSVEYSTHRWESVLLFLLTKSKKVTLDDAGQMSAWSSDATTGTTEVSCTFTTAQHYVRVYWLLSLIIFRIHKGYCHVVQLVMLLCFRVSWAEGQADQSALGCHGIIAGGSIWFSFFVILVFTLFEAIQFDHSGCTHHALTISRLRRFERSYTCIPLISTKIIAEVADWICYLHRQTQCFMSLSIKRKHGINMLGFWDGNAPCFPWQHHNMLPWMIE